MNNYIEARLVGISLSNYLYYPYKDQSDRERYELSGVESKSYDLGHYCSIDVLKEIVEKGSLRFTDVRYLNDSTEFIEIIPQLKEALNTGDYSEQFTIMHLPVYMV